MSYITKCLYAVFTITLFCLSTGWPFETLAYEPSTTHAGLSQEIVDFYNATHRLQISSFNKEMLIRGSVDEDFPAVRVVNHFYDPIRNIGINDGHTAKDWALGKITESDFTWPNAIKYYAEGDGAKAFYYLGHVIHLMADMTVPDHTRNDPHMGVGAIGLFTGESLLEEWASEHKNRTTISGLYLKYLAEGEKGKVFNNLSDYFDFLANYSNRNFLSKDTINSDIYRSPSLGQSNKWYVYWVDPIDLDSFKISTIGVDSDNKNFYILETYDDKSVLSGYFDRLAKQAILSGAGVIELFLKEAGSARIDYLAKQRAEQEAEIAKAVALNKQLSGASTPALIAYGLGFIISDNVISPISQAVATIGNGFNTGVGIVSSATLNGGKVLAYTTSALAKTAVNKTMASIASGLGYFTPTVTMVKPSVEKVVVAPSVISKPLNIPVPLISQSQTQTQIEVQPVEVPPTEALPQNEVTINLGTEFPSEMPVEEFVPEVLEVEVGIEVEVEVEAEADIGVGAGEDIEEDIVDGGGYVAMPIVYVATPIPESRPVPSYGSDSRFDINQNLIVVAPLVATTSEEVVVITEVSTSTEATSTEELLPSDTTPPTVSLTVSECQSSISPDSCLTMSTSLHISWSSDDEDLDHYILNLDGVVSTTTATSTVVAISSEFIYSILVSAVDRAGNISASASKTVYVSQTPVVINELAWGGTATNATDEWIELYNRTSHNVDLSGFTLYSKTDGSPYINLSGIIPAYGFFLIEAKNTGETDEATQSSVGDIVADLWVNFGMRMVNTGENIVLTFASTTVDQIPYCFNWCGAPSSRTTERFDPDISGGSSSNWSANNAVIYNGHDIGGRLIMGTPRARNSSNYLINRGTNTTSDVTLTKRNSPYLVNNTTQTVNQGDTLTIEPGVVIKFRSAARLSVKGNIVANGTADDPIVFTTFTDDEYGGDMDRVVATSTKGSWFGVELANTSATSSFDHTIFRYGGNYGQGTYRKTMLYADHVSPSITNSTFEFSKAYGAYLNFSNSDVSNNIFRDNIGDAFSAGLYAYYGKPTISGNTFERNKVGMYVYSPVGDITDNSFSDNTIAASLAGAMQSVVTGNSGDAGSMINLSGSIATAGATTTLVANPMPYFLSGIVSVPADSTLDIKEGTVIKNSINGSASLLSVYGKLNIDTSTTTGVIFSSIISTSTKAGWMGIYMNAGSSSYIKGATIQNSTIGIKYTSSPIDLEDVTFSTNGTAVRVMGTSPVIKASNVIFINNTTSKSPSNAW